MTLSHPVRRPASRRWGVAALTLAVVAGFALAAPDPTASADTAPPEANLPATVSTDLLPTVQIDGVAWSQVVVGNRVFAGGEWATARPAGAAAGVSTVAQANLLSYDVRTGVMDAGFRPVVDAQILAVAASPDGSTLYIGGDFSKVDGQPRSRLAAFDVATGALTAWNPGANNRVYSLAATQDTVYAGGWLTAAGSAARTSVAALDPVTGRAKSFAPAVAGTENAAVRAIAVSPDGTKVMLGGQFETVNGAASAGGYGLSIVDAATGKTSQPLAANSVIRNARNAAAILSLVGSGDAVYGTGFHYKAGGATDGNLEGSFKVGWDGKLVWVEDCHGDTYSVFPTQGAVYIAGHPHYCGNIGGFEETKPITYHRALAFTPDARGTVANEPYDYHDFLGQPKPQWLNWFPDLNNGAYTKQYQGPWHVSGNSDYVVYSGEFTTVNNKPQQGLARFARPGLAPNLDGPRLSGTGFVPTAQSFSQGVRLQWPANYDRDSELLTYKLIRNGDTAHPIATIDQRSTFWWRPTVSFLDTTAVPGQSYTYRVWAVDPVVNGKAGNIAKGADVSVTAAGGSSLSGYDRTVLADSPQYYWRLAETSGTAVADTAGGGGTATRQAGVTVGVPGGIADDPGTAYRFPGTSTGSVATDTAEVGKQIFSTEAWFKTTSTTGGKILSFGSSQTGSSTNADRQIYLSNTGQVIFGTIPAGVKAIYGPSGKNDGRWHHVVATLDASGLKLFVDGALSASRTDYYQGQRYTGYWRIGGDVLQGWPGNPTSGYLAGDIDDAAVYPKALTPAQVSAHYAAGKGTTAAANVAPTASFTSTSTGLTAAFDASGSRDTDGTVASYAWTYGDGTTGTGATPSRTYAAAGTYTVGLVVTDNAGATATTTRSVTVAAPAPATPPAAGAFVADTFDRTVSQGFGTAPTGGPWTASSTASDVAGGAGRYHLLRASSGPEAYLGATTRTSTDLRMNVSTDKIADGSGLQLNAYARRVSATADYRAVVTVGKAGAASVSLTRLEGTTSTSLAAAKIVAGTVTPGSPLHLRVQAFGTSPSTVRAKLWLGSEAEPAAWTVTAQDSTPALQVAGAVGLKPYLFGSVTNVPVVVSLLDVDARPVE